jgi:hypothetical protein
MAGRFLLAQGMPCSLFEAYVNEWEWRQCVMPSS